MDTRLLDNVNPPYGTQTIEIQMYLKDTVHITYSFDPRVLHVKSLRNIRGITHTINDGLYGLYILILKVVTWNARKIYRTNLKKLSYFDMLHLDLYHVGKRIKEYEKVIESAKFEIFS